MESGPERAICHGCGGEFPRAEMFGLDGDQRCPDCAHALRNRHNPAAVRRPSMSFRATSSAPDGRVTAGVLALMVVLFVAELIPTPLKGLLEGATQVWGYPVPEAEPPRPLPPPGPEATPTEVEQWEESTRNLEQAHRAWEEQRFIPTTRPKPWLLLLWAFMHGGILHLAMNGMWLHQAGRWIELGWGRWTYGLVLVGSAAASTAAGWLVSAAPTIGISGGIFALIGWLLIQRRRHPVAISMMTRSYLNSLAASLVLLVILSEFGGWRISHVGHLTGFLWGLAGGLTVSSRRPAIGWSLLTAGTLALLLLPTFVEPLGWNLTLFGRGT